MSELHQDEPLAATEEQASSWKPTRKWGVSVVGGASALALMWVTTGSWDQEESISLIGLVTTALSTYLIPNNPENLNSP